MGVLLLLLGSAQAGELSGGPGVEELRLEAARAQLPGVVRRYEALIGQAATVADQAELSGLGTALWEAATADLQAGHSDDRSLYWARLAIRRAILERPSPLPLDAFERASRGIRMPPADAARGRRILLTGFDPFHLDQNIEQSNPSGLAALLLDGTRLDAAGVTAYIEAAVFPVRFADFDRGMVESFFGPWIEAGRADLVLTISMGRDAFDLERFPGRRRSSAVTDNLNVLTGASASSPLVPLLNGEPLSGPEFVEFSLPAAAMLAVQSPWLVRDNRNVSTLEQGALQPASLAELAGLTAVSGSGGGYLSNEISYRSVLLARRHGAAVPIGHLHTPRVSGYDADVERQMVEQIRRLLAAAVASL